MARVVSFRLALAAHPCPRPRLRPRARLHTLQTHAHICSLARPCPPQHTSSRTASLLLFLASSSSHTPCLLLSRPVHRGAAASTAEDAGRCDGHARQPQPQPQPQPHAPRRPPPETWPQQQAQPPPDAAAGAQAADQASAGVDADGDVVSAAEGRGEDRPWFLSLASRGGFAESLFSEESMLELHRRPPPPTTAERVVRAAEHTLYYVAFAVAGVLAVVVACGVFGEVVLPSSAQHLYLKALDRVRSEQDVRRLLGEPILAHGREAYFGHRHVIPHRAYRREDGVRCARIKFTVLGPLGSGEVWADFSLSTWRECLGGRCAPRFNDLVVDLPRLGERLVLIGDGGQERRR